MSTKTIELLKPNLSVFWALQISGWLLYGVVVYFIGRPFNPSDYVTFLRVSVETGLGFAVSLILRYLYDRILTASVALITVASSAIAFSIIVAVPWSLITDYFASVIAPDWIERDRILLYAAKGSLNHTFVLLSWSAIYLGTRYWQDVQDQKENALKATALAHEAQLQMLRYQLNPHFFFNTLTSVRALIDEDTTRAKRMITQLSEFLRYSLLPLRTEITLKEEVEAICCYIAIEKIRFEEKLDVDFEIDPAVHQCLIPAFLIHPLIENALKHGMQVSPMPLKVRLSAQLDDGNLHIDVSNTGDWIYASEDHRGIGIRNVQQRLIQSYPDLHDFQISHEDGLVRVGIVIRKPQWKDTSKQS